MAGRQGADVRIEGLPKLRRELREAGESLEDLKGTHRQISGLVASRGKSAGPRKSGALLASVRPSAATSAIRVMAGRAAVPYAGPIHWGWPSRNIGAQPWIRQAATATQSQWLGMYEQGIERELGKVRGDR